MKTSLTQRKLLTLAVGEHWNEGATAPAPVGDFHPHPCCSRTLQPGLDLTEIPLLTVRGGSGAPCAESNALAPGNVTPGLYQGHWARPRVHPPGECSQVGLPPLCASILPPCPLLLHWLFSGGQDDTWAFSNHSPSRSKGQLCVVPVLFLSILSPFLSGCSICCYHMGFFSHKYSLSALDASFCCQTHTFCPFSQ